MAPEVSDTIHERAIGWHIRLRDGDDATWEAFAGWLAEDPRHAEAYETIESIDIAIEPLLSGVVFREAANDTEAPVAPPARHTRRWLLGGGALAASLAAAIVLAPHLMSGRYQVATEPGERRIVTLDSATQVVLNGSTRMTFDRRNARFAALAEGEALFRIRHDSADPFILELGDDTVEDAGTIFNVIREPGKVRVAVAEGAVIYNPEREGVALNAGEALVDRAGPTGIRVTSVPVQAVGSWEKGRLTYSQAPMSVVAADLARTLGVAITVAPSLADRPFSGSIALDGKGPEQFRRLELALNVTMESGRDGWTMKPANGARR